MKNKKSNWFINNNISFVLAISLLIIIALIISIVYYEQKAALTFGLVLPLSLIVLGLMTFNTIISLKHLGFDWYDKWLYMHISFILYIVLAIIGFGLYSYSWSNLFLLIVNGLYFVYIGLGYNFYKNELIAYYKQGDKDGK